MSKQITWEEINIENIGGIEGVDDGVEGDDMLDSMPFLPYILKNTKYWLMHTNFNLSPKILGVIELTDGVDRLMPISRYRALVNFGNLFNVEEVKKAINQNLTKSFNTNNLWKKVPRKKGTGGTPYKEEDN